MSTSAITELRLWLKHLKNANSSLQDIPVACTIQTDASEQERIATDGNTPIGGRWSSLERNHFNVLELKAMLLTDNSTELAYINNMGGIDSVLCNDIAETYMGICT